MLKSVIVVLFLISVGFSQNLLACANINLQVRENSPLHRIPIYDQNGLGACYAYAASQLMDYQRIKNGFGGSQYGLTSPIWLAMKYSLFQGDLSIEGGDIADAINEAKSEGVCKKPVVDQILTYYKAGNSLTDAELLDIIERIDEVWERPEYTNIGEIFDAALTESTSGLYCPKPKTLRDKIFENFRIPGDKFNQVVATAFLEKAFLECTDENIYTPRMPEAHTACERCSDSEMDNRIERILKANQPVGISYCSRVLNDGDYRGVSSSRNDLFRFSSRSDNVLLEKDKEDQATVGKMTKGCGRHASILVGSRNQGGKCQYLLRNTWGSTSYSEHQECLCEISTGLYVACRHGDGRPNKVGCWIDSEELTPNIYRLTHFED